MIIENLEKRDLSAVSADTRPMTAVPHSAFNAPMAALVGNGQMRNMSPSDLAHVKRQQIAAFWNAPTTAHDWHILAAIHGAWESLGVPG